MPDEPDQGIDDDLGPYRGVVLSDAEPVRTVSEPPPAPAQPPTTPAQPPTVP